MPRGQRKRSQFDFTIWLKDGAKARWWTTKDRTEGEIADAIEKYLLPIVKSIRSRQAADAVGLSDDPPVASNARS